MATTNFLQHNPGAVNQESDSDYNGDSLRAGGIGTNAIVPSAWLNKTFYQVTTFVSAFAQMLVSKGITTSDASVATLVTELSSVVVESELTSGLAGKANGTGYTAVQQGTGGSQLGNAVKIGWDGSRTRITIDATDQGPITMASDATALQNTLQANINAEATSRTNADNTLQSNITNESATRSSADATITTSLNTLIASLASSLSSATASKQLGEDGLILKFCSGNTVTEAGVSTQSGSWPGGSFPNTCIAAFCVAKTSQGGAGSAGDTDVHDFQITSYSASGYSVRHSVGGVYSQAQTLTPILFAIGY